MNHTLSAYDDELQSVKYTMHKMTDIIEKQLNKSLVVLLEHDTELAEEIHQRDEKVNQLNIKIEQKIVNIFALRQPMANDLRWLVSCLQISSELERIGDYADNISKHTDLLNNMPDELIEITKKLEQMIKLVIVMFRDVIRSFVDNDKDLAVSTWEQDRKVNSFQKKINKEYMNFILEENQYIKMTTKLLFVVKTAERIGDRVANIAERVYYTITGNYLN